jgi:hypothetical protein
VLTFDFEYYNFVFRCLLQVPDDGDRCYDDKSKNYVGDFGDVLQPLNSENVELDSRQPVCHSEKRSIGDW